MPLKTDCPDLETIATLVGALGPEGEARVAHVVACDLCRGQLRQLALLRSLIEPEPGDGAAHAVEASWNALTGAGLGRVPEAERALASGMSGRPAPRALVFGLGAVAAFLILSTAGAAQGLTAPMGAQVIAALLGGAMAAWRAPRTHTRALST